MSGIELWKSDGTPSGTVQVKDIYPGAADASPAGLANINGTLVFAANDGVNGIELWKSRGTTESTLLAQNIASGAGDSHPAEFVMLGTKLFFRANDDTTGTELWSISLQPNGLNFAPFAASTTISTAANTPVTGTLPASDPDGDALTFTLINFGNPAKGTATLNNPATGAGAIRIPTTVLRCGGSSTNCGRSRMRTLTSNSRVSSTRTAKCRPKG